jgi:hypothetical protein
VAAFLGGAPTFFVNGRFLIGAQASAIFRSVVEEELRKNPSKKYNRAHAAALSPEKKLTKLEEAEWNPCRSLLLSDVEKSVDGVKL